MHIQDLEKIPHTKTQFSSIPYLTQTIGKENIKDVHHLSRSLIDTAHFRLSKDRTPDRSLLIHALNTCYDLHLPFSLSPEIVWYTIISEIATCVKADPETYAHLYTTTPKEKQKIVVYINEFVYGQPNDWGQGIAQFKPELEARVPSNILQHTVKTFSTSTPEVDISLLMTFMDAASPFYSYRMVTLCGIPDIKLLGTVDDWSSIRASVMTFQAWFPALEPYLTRLTETLTKIINTYFLGMTDISFWRNIYKIGGGSGGPYISGWITDLFAYSYDNKTPRLLTYRGHITTDNMPTHISTVPFTWEYFGTEIPMLFVTGIMGIEIDEEGFYTPKLGFGVIETPPKLTE
jgi:hypothetical protein